MEHIYIVMTNTGTILSKLIKLSTHAKYQHVSISLDRDLRQMYSFGRKNPYNPVYGGFVKEGIDIGTFKRFYKTKAKIIEASVTNKEYKELSAMIKKMSKNQKDLSFNIIGLCCAALGIKLHRKRKFYCSEFVQELIHNCDCAADLPKVARPNDFNKIKGKTIYIGPLQEYTKFCENERC